MFELAIMWEWLAFAVRWLHVVTAIAWIGSSFYFIALDLGLNRNISGPADGEEWQVHGGGFYHIQKFMVAPDALPDHLTWFKWESYATWLSGAALLAVVYWAGAEFYLIDLNKADLSVGQAVLLSACSLAIGWLIYDALCRSPLGERPSVMMLALFALIVVMAWGYAQIFTGRAALLHLGAFTATIMTANVFLIIIPNQKIVVADLRAGRSPDPRFGKIAKLRSTHNNYLTLPVVFLMLSNHYPLAYATDWNWLIAALVFLMGVTIRHYFNTRHARQGSPNWTWAATLAIFLAIMGLSTVGAVRDEPPPSSEEVVLLSDRQKILLDSPLFFEVHDTITGRCSMCHARQPVWQGIRWAPKNVILETEADILRNAPAIYLHAGVTRAMPPSNLSYMTDEERAVVRNWFAGGQDG